MTLSIVGHHGPLACYLHAVAACLISQMCISNRGNRPVHGTRRDPYVFLPSRSAAGEKGKGFGKAEAPQAASTATKQRDKKWELKAAQTDEWKAWVEEQKQAAGVKADVEDIYVQVRHLPWLCLAC